MAPPQPEVPIWIMLPIVILFFGGLGFFAFWLDQRRREGLDRLARELGLDYRDDCPAVSVPEDFHLMKAGVFTADHEARWSLEGNIDGVDLSVFDFRRYDDTTSPKRHQYGYSETVGVFTIPGMDFPEFILRPERLRHKLRSAITGDDIDFADSPRFSRRYLLAGEREKDIREVFVPEVRAFFEDHPGCIVQGCGKDLVLYHPTRMLSLLVFRAHKVRRLVDEGLDLVELLKR
jgi:hypothetical protein